MGDRRAAAKGSRAGPPPKDKKEAGPPTKPKAVSQGPRNADGEEPTRTVALEAWIKKVRGKHGRLQNKSEDDGEDQEGSAAARDGEQEGQGANGGREGMEDEEMVSDGEEEEAPEQGEGCPSLDELAGTESQSESEEDLAELLKDARKCYEQEERRYARAVDQHRKWSKEALEECVEAALEAQLQNALVRRDEAKQVLEDLKEQCQKRGSVKPHTYRKAKKAAAAARKRAEQSEATAKAARELAETYEQEAAADKADADKKEAELRQLDRKNRATAGPGADWVVGIAESYKAVDRYAKKLGERGESYKQGAEGALEQLRDCLERVAAELREQVKKGKESGPTIQGIDEEDESEKMGVGSLAGQGNTGAGAPTAPEKGRPAETAANGDEAMGEGQGDADAAPPPPQTRPGRTPRLPMRARRARAGRMRTRTKPASLQERLRRGARRRPARSGQGQKSGGG